MTMSYRNKNTFSSLTHNLIGAMLIILTATIGTGCQSTSEERQGAAGGAAIGAGIGALLGQAIGGDTESTLLGAGIGAAIGGGVGYSYGKTVSERKEHYKSESEFLDAQIADVQAQIKQTKKYNEQLTALLDSASKGDQSALKQLPSDKEIKDRITFQGEIIEVNREEFKDTSGEKKEELNKQLTILEQQHAELEQLRKRTEAARQ